MGHVGIFYSHGCYGPWDIYKLQIPQHDFPQTTMNLESPLECNGRFSLEGIPHRNINKRLDFPTVVLHLELPGWTFVVEDCAKKQTLPFVSIFVSENPVMGTTATSMTLDSKNSKFGRCFPHVLSIACRAKHRRGLKKFVVAFSVPSKQRMESNPWQGTV